MALGLLLGVSWVCLLVFNGSDGSPAKGYGYPYKSDSRNMDEEDDLTSLIFDESDFQASNNQPPGPVYTSYNTPTVTQQPAWTPYGQNLPNTPSKQVDGLINGVPRDWGQENLDEPIVFPLSSNPAKPQTGPVQPQSTAFSVSTNNMPNPLGAGASTQYASPTAYHGPSSSFQARESPNFSLQPEPLDGGYGVVDFNAGSSAAGGNVPHLAYEDVFQYPDTPEASQSSDSVSNKGGYGQADVSRGSSTGYSSTYDEPSIPSYPNYVLPQPLYLPGRREGTPGGIGGHSSQPAYQPRDEIAQQPPKTFNTKKVEVNQRVSEPIPPPPPLSSYIVQSRNAYARRRELNSKTKYTPEFPPPMPVSSKGPASSQPAAPKNAKDPEGAKW